MNKLSPKSFRHFEMILSTDPALARAFAGRCGDITQSVFGGNRLIVSAAPHEIPHIDKLHRDTLARRIYSLTDRQRDVIDLFERGHQTAEVAATLSISETAVNKHKAAILKRIDVTSWICAVALYARAKYGDIT